MTKLLLCDISPVTAVGVKVVLRTSGFKAVGNVGSVEETGKLVSKHGPNVVLLGRVVKEVLASLKDEYPNLYVVVWGFHHEREVLELLRLGVKGVIHHKCDVATLVDCLQAVARGEVWVEQAMTQERPRVSRQELTSREVQVFEKVQAGMKNKEIAVDLGIRPGTVKIHLKHIFEKTGVRGRFGLAMNSLRAGASAQIH